jgi:hypothetical protein
LDRPFCMMVVSVEWNTHRQASRADPRRCARGAAGFGTEATVLWWPTRSKAARFSTRRQASEGRSGRPGCATATAASDAEDWM